MSFLDHQLRYNLQLLARNEGKLKSYESCFDVRAWSHDIQKRDLYLREWIRRDMPLCIVPVSTLVGFFKAMTCRRNGRAVPRCHPDCKSKVILGSIATSCVAMRECLKADENLEKFFIEEELESSHWPCERCLDALKNIKLFWRIMLEKVFGINITKNECFEDTSCCSQTDSVRDMAQSWKRDMLQQAIFVKSITQKLLCTNVSRTSCRKSCIKNKSNCYIPTPCSERDTRNLQRKASNTTISSRKGPNKKVSLECSSNCEMHKKNCKSKTSEYSSTCEIHKSNKIHQCSSACNLLNNCCGSHSVSNFMNKCKTSECSSNCNIAEKCIKSQGSSCNLAKKLNSPLKKTCKCTSVTIETVDVCCGTRSEMESFEIIFNENKKEIEKLKIENCSLKCELQNLYNDYKWKPIFYSPPPSLEKDNTALIPKPFECCIEDSCSNNSAKDAESELIITMKNGTNENFKHVRMLQVLHKTNDPILQDISIDGPCYKNEDPILLLNKVHTTLGQMVNREMAALACKKRCGSNSEIEASFQRLNGCKSDPTRSTLSSHCTLNSSRSR